MADLLVFCSGTVPWALFAMLCELSYQDYLSFSNFNPPRKDDLARRNDFLSATSWWPHYLGRALCRPILGVYTWLELLYARM